MTSMSISDTQHTEMVEIDVLICAYNEALHIPRILESLRLQSVGSRTFRVIFIDNASTDDTRRVVQENAHGLNLEYVYEARVGLNFARSAGYQNAQAPYVAHIDADAKADPHWIENIQKVIRQEQPDLCGGPYFPYHVTPKPVWFLDRYNSNYKGDTPHYLQEHEYLSGTNMIWRRSVVEQLGGFKPDIGLIGRGLARGDEVNLIMRARNELPNFRAFYHPGIVVYHLTRPEVFSLWYWARRHFSLGCHSHRIWMRGDGPASVGRLRLLARAAWILLAFAVDLARGVLLRDRKRYPYVQNYLYERVLRRLQELGAIYEQYRQIVRQPEVERCT